MSNAITEHKCGRQSISFVHPTGLEVILISGKRRQRAMRDFLSGQHVDGTTANFVTLRHAAFAARPAR